MNYALIKDAIVQNVIVADAEFVDSIADAWDHIEPLDTAYEQSLAVGVGWGWDGQQFLAPPPVEPPASRVLEVSELQFRGLFTQAEKRAIYAAAAVDVDVQIWLDDLRALSGKPVLLTDPRTVAGVHALESAGVIGPGRAEQILAAHGLGGV